MPRHCSAAGCKSRDTRETRKAGITFHRLPKRGSSRRTQWILNSQRKDPQGKGQWDPQSHFIYFCSKHFTPESFELSGVSGYRRLKEDALPTVFETFSRQKRCTGDKGQRTSKQTQTTRQARRQTRSLKQSRTVLEPDNQQGTESSAGARKAAGGVDSLLEDASEQNSAVNEARGAGMGTKPLPSANSPLPSSFSQSSPHTSQVLLPPSESAPSSSQIAAPFPTDPQSASSPQPPSPSRYMKRLPPPPGFHLPREHSYAQLCPSVWRKRYDRAIDSLEKTLRLLNAARRRETRLRHTLLRLREDRLRQTLLNLRGGAKWKESRDRVKQSLHGGIRERADRAVRQGTDEQEMEIERMAEELNLFDDEAEDSGEWGGYPQSSSTRTKEKMGYCFYCGRGQKQLGDLEEGSSGTSEKVKEVLEDKDGSQCRETDEKNQHDQESRVTTQNTGRTQEKIADTGTEACCYYYYYSGCTGEQEGNAVEDVQIVTMELPQGWQLSPQQQQAQPVQPQAATLKSVSQTGALQELCRLQVPLQPEKPNQKYLTSSLSTGSLQAVSPSQDLHLLQSMRLELHKPQVQMQQVELVHQGLTTQPRVFVMDSEGQVGVGTEDQQVFWVQEDRDGHLLLVPVPGEDVRKSTAQKELRDAAVQPLLVSEVGFHNDMTDGSLEPYLEAGEGGQRITGQAGKEGGCTAEVRAAAGSGDLREKLKEHLEGFQLQLSNEFIN
ncbi:THAP domain-containing protein 7 [Paramormyrops kingsleyae]|uniref:THAP domain-containing protein 7 n=1 Tax=Paramormyrops kingsleyae TaxID=1676925 RepID=UPI003B97BE47